MVANAQAATTFLEPGGDATFNVATVANNGFWSIVSGAAVATDFVHGSHIKSIKYRANSFDVVQSPNGVLNNTGTRVSFYLYINALPSATTGFANLRALGGANGATIRLTSAGVLQLWNQSTAQIGSDGSALSTGVWYRISLAATITSSTVNRFELFKDGVSDISVTNATLTNVTTGGRLVLGNTEGNSTLDIRTSDHYIDDLSSLTDTGNIWVTAKRPNTNGTANEFTTQIGESGSGFGSGHSSQVNERALDTANGWSIQDASKKTEEYTIESLSQGDIDLTGTGIVDYVGWVSAKVGSASTGNIIVAGSATNISVTTAYQMFTKVAGSTTYPAGNTDIGMDTNSVNQLFSLAEAGIIVAYSPNTKAITAFDFNALSPAVIGVIDEGAKTVTLTVPYGTSLTNLVPTINQTGASVSPASGAAQTFVDGTSINYTVTAADASTQVYAVTVNVGDNPDTFGDKWDFETDFETDHPLDTSFTHAGGSVTRNTTQPHGGSYSIEMITPATIYKRAAVVKTWNASEGGFEGGIRVADLWFYYPNPSTDGAIEVATEAWSGTQSHLASIQHIKSDAYGLEGWQYWRNNQWNYIPGGGQGATLSQGAWHHFRSEVNYDLNQYRRMTIDDTSYDMTGLSYDVAASGLVSFRQYSILRWTQTAGSVTMFVDDVRFGSMGLVPQAPTIGAPQAQSASSIRWNFTDNSNDETGFKIYDNNDNTVNSATPDGLSYLDETGLLCSTGYSGRYIKAYNSYGESVASAVASSQSTNTCGEGVITGIIGSRGGTLGMTAPVIPSQATTTLASQVVGASSVFTTTPKPLVWKFTSNLKLGMKGNDVKQLQIFLNQHLDSPLAKSGPGSTGNETDFFGPLTKAAVIRCQEKHAQEILAPWGLTKGTGLVGRTTRAKINELIMNK